LPFACVNVPLQISSGIFVYGEITRYKCTQSTKVTICTNKEPRNGNSKVNKKLIKVNFVSKSYQAQLMEWIAVDDFFTDKAQDKEHSQHFSKSIDF